MNVVYRGLPNPMTISFAGIPESDVTASATGLTSAGKGKYNLNINEFNFSISVSEVNLVCSMNSKIYVLNYCMLTGK